MSILRGSQKSLILISRQLGVHIGPNDIPENFKIENRELTSDEYCKLAKNFNIKAKSTTVSEKDLINLLSKKQQVLRLKNGRYIIALRILAKDEEKFLLFLDVGNPNPKPQQIALEELSKAWLGEIILTKLKKNNFS
mgnify:FL=1